MQHETNRVAATVSQIETFLAGLKAPTIVLSAERAAPFRSLSLPREVFADLVSRIADEVAARERVPGRS
jgi:hypothetical protein